MRDPLLLLLGPFDHPHRDLLAVNAGMVARALGGDVTAYWTAPREGGIFARHGGSLAGGRHHEALATLLATRAVTVLRCGGTPVFADLVARGAERVIDLVEEPAGWLAQLADLAGDGAPARLLAIPTAGLPEALAHGVASAFAPLARHRDAWLVPLESNPAAWGRNAVLVATLDDDAVAPWEEAGYAVETVHRIAADATPDGLAFAVADALPDDALTGWLLAEPTLAAERLPGAVVTGTGIVCAASTDDLAPVLTQRLKARGQTNLVARYGGGPIGRLSSDEGLFPLFAAGVSIHVEEPGRPAFPLVHPAEPVYPRCGEPRAWAATADDQLRAWAREGRMLLAVVSHSGEQSHDECLPALYDAAAHAGMCWGIGTHTHRIERHPEAVEPSLLPEAAGGVRDRCELVLHSAGDGIIAERPVDPAALAARMAAKRDRIAGLVGLADAPVGTLMYLDADPADWSAPATALWRALKDAGFRYVLSSVAPDRETLLYRDGDFVVLPCAGSNCFPYSPFVRVHRDTDLTDRLNSRQRRLGPSYLVAVIDLPVIADPASLLFGDRYREDHPTLGPLVRALTTECRPNIVTTTPAVVARYAAIVDAHDY